MTAKTMEPMMPTVVALSAAASAAWFGSTWFPRPIAVPVAASSAVRITAVPVAVNHPKNAEPNFIPPNCSFSRASTCSRVVSPPVTVYAAAPAVPEDVFGSGRS